MRWALAVLALLAAAGWVLTAPRGGSAALPGGDAAAGEAVFHAAGCAGCHAAPEAEGAARLVLAGGRRFETVFGTFVAPNVSMDPAQGIGAWTGAQFADAVRHGVSPEGAHYYPAFPWTTYARMTDGDVADLWAYWQGLPASDAASLPHDLSFPATVRRGVGAWKLLHGGSAYATPAPDDPAAARGRYLAEALGHCGECHTPRLATGGLDLSRWLAGAPNPSGRGRIPAIHPAALGWSEGEIAAYLADGFTPEFDVAGGSMAEVIRSTAELPEADRAAIAAYLVQVPDPVAPPAD